MNVNQELLEKLLGVKQQDLVAGLRGILQTSDYDTFMILSDTGTTLHKFQGSKKANKCLPGDHVAWEKEQCVLELRDEHPLIVGTVELTNKSKYGLTKRGIPMYLFTPYNKKYPHFIVGCSEKDTSKNIIGLIKLESWDTTFPRGSLQQTLGTSGDNKAEKEALIWQASPYKWPKHDYQPKQHESTNRVVVKGYTFHIDPEGCRDVDDVFTFEQLEDHTWRITISISDVASYVEDGSAVDIMASLIGQTLYDPEGHVLRPMLPAVYSEETCSLLPGKESYGVSLQLIWNGSTLSNHTWLETNLIVDRSYSYEEFQTSSSPYKQPLAEIASYLAKEEVKDAHKWVEHMMILYNTEAGALLKKAGMGILRKHAAPDVKKLERYHTYVPELQQLAFSSAEYCLAEEEETVHYGLGSAAYAHASSPIRRYADIINQRVLKKWIAHQGSSKDYYIVPIAMYDMNQRGKEIKRHARDYAFLTAISTGQTTFQGRIMEKQVMDNNQLRIIVYVSEWKRMISTTYQALSDNVVLSRDEKTEIDVSDFKEVTITCAFTPNARNWKERIILHLG
jgi:exoribonuclease R